MVTFSINGLNFKGEKIVCFYFRNVNIQAAGSIKKTIIGMNGEWKICCRWVGSLYSTNMEQKQSHFFLLRSYDEKFSFFFFYFLFILFSIKQQQQARFLFIVHSCCCCVDNIIQWWYSHIHIFTYPHSHYVIVCHRSKFGPSCWFSEWSNE